MAEGALTSHRGNMVEESAEAKPLLYAEADAALPHSHACTSNKVEEVLKHVDIYIRQVHAQHAPPSGTLECSRLECSLGHSGHPTEQSANSERTSRSLYHCVDCTTHKYYCRKCIVSLHRDNAFHRISEWGPNFDHKKRTSLAELGLEMELVHSDGTPCNCKGKRKKIRVLHTNGMQEIWVRPCERKGVGNPIEARLAQYSANRLFPATHNDPKTVFTFAVLNMFDVFNLQSAIKIKQFLDGVLQLAPESYRTSEEVGYLHGGRTVLTEFRCAHH